MSLRALAAAAKITPAALCRIEQEKHGPRAITIQKISEVLNVSIAELMTGTARAPMPEVDSMMKELTTENYAKVVDYLDYVLRRQRAAQAIAAITPDEDGISRTKRTRRRLGQGVIVLAVTAAAIASAGAIGAHTAAAAAVIPGAGYVLDITSPGQGSQEKAA